MIRDIKEVHLPNATLNEATVSLSDMGEKNISATVEIDGKIVPNFSKDWEVVFKGEKYIMPLRKPKASKENTSLNSKIELNFQHWAMYQLKRFYFFEVPSKGAGVLMPDQWIVPLNLTLPLFCEYLEKVCRYWYGDKITVNLNPDYEYDLEPSGIDISYSKVWDVLIKLYEVYAVRWTIEPRADNDNTTVGGERYEIRIGYEADELTHIFEYGFDGGLLKIERQIQNEDIANVILGRGGEKNIPYRYFKDTDKDNPSFTADPDWIPELKDIYFSNIRGRAFRDYIRGWKASHYGGKQYPPSTAYNLGYYDSVFSPIEWVRDAESIKKYGEIWGALDNNEEIYPTIQGIISTDHQDFFTIESETHNIGRIDQIVAIDQIESDDVEQSVENEATTNKLPKLEVTTNGMSKYERVTTTLFSSEFSIEDGKTGNILLNDYELSVMSAKGNKVLDNSTGQYAQVEKVKYTVYDIHTSQERSAIGIPKGKYTLKIEVSFYNASDEDIRSTIRFNNITLTQSTAEEQWGSTFNIWIKNIWATRKGYDDNGKVIPNETDSQYAERVWRPILGDREGNEAKVVFSSGWLSTSEDYEFTIIKTPVLDTSKTHDGVPSHWRITLAKSDADLESTGLYLPSTKRNGKAGDFFFFIGIDLPHAYVLWAEDRVDAWKNDELAKVKDIRPTWAVTLDKIRIDQKQSDSAQRIVDTLKIGSAVTIFDKRFSEGSNQEKLYLQQISYKFTKDSLLPDVDVVLGTEYEISASPVATLQGSVEAISKQVGSLSNIEQIVRLVGDKLYLRKDGFPDKSMSPTEFYSLLSSNGFREGMVGGAGWGFFKDNNGNWVLETDKINVRQDFQVNNLVINQVEGRGGVEVSCAAVMEINLVIETNDGYECYFDQKDGTIANLFHLDDIAWCNRFDSTYNTEKFYKRRVIEVGANYVKLTKPYKGDKIKDSGVNGDGVPEIGDVIVHYGNYTDETRRYVAIRDVVGGAYTRFLDNLKSVNSTGEEYFFVGRQNGMYGDKPRFFIGGRDSYIKYEEGRVKIKADLEIGSTYNGEVIDLSGNKEYEAGGVNLVLNSKYYEQNAYSELNRYHLSTNLKPDSLYTFTLQGRLGADRTKFSLYVLADSANLIFLSDLAVIEDIPESSDSIFRATFRTPKTLTPGIVDYLDIAVMQNPSGTSLSSVNWVKLETGNLPTDWSPAPQDFNYITSALTENTLIRGGLIQTTAVTLGYTHADGSYTIMSGSNGRYDNSELGGGISFWSGGSMIDREKQGLSPNEMLNAATYIMRMDGSGYMASGYIKWDATAFSIGNGVILNDEGLFMYDSDGSLRLQVSQSDVGDLIDDDYFFLRNLYSENGIGGGVSVKTWRNTNPPVIDPETGSTGDVEKQIYVAETKDIFYKSLYNGKRLNKGASFSLIFGAGITTASTGYVMHCKFRIDFICNGKIISQNRYNYENLWNGSFSKTLSFVVPEDGVCAVYIYVEPIKSVSTPNEQYSFWGSIDGKSSNILKPKTVIGRDGFITAWKHSAVRVIESGVTFRYKNYGFRLTDNGVQKMTDGENWVVV